MWAIESQRGKKKIRVLLNQITSKREVNLDKPTYSESWDTYMDMWISSPHQHLAVFGPHIKIDVSLLLVPIPLTHGRRLAVTEKKTLPPSLSIS